MEKTLSKENEKRIFESIFQNIVLYGAEISDESEK